MNIDKEIDNIYEKFGDGDSDLSKHNIKLLCHTYHLKKLEELEKERGVYISNRDLEILKEECYQDGYDDGQMDL